MSLTRLKGRKQITLALTAGDGWCLLRGYDTKLNDLYEMAKSSYQVVQKVWNRRENQEIFSCFDIYLLKFITVFTKNTSSSE